MNGFMLVFTTPRSADDEMAYNDWYDKTHIPQVLAVPGFVDASRYKASDLRPRLAGAEAHDYVAVYEVDASQATAALDELRARIGSGEIAIDETVSTNPGLMTAYYEPLDR